MNRIELVLIGVVCLCAGVSMLVSPFLWRVIDFVFGLGLGVAVFAAVAIVLAALFMMLNAAHAEPPYDDCPYGSYRAPSGDCVERPDNNPAGATAVCNDGTLSHSEHPYSGGTRSHHGGVSRYLGK
jgi:hypothetical protein